MSFEQNIPWWTKTPAKIALARLHGGCRSCKQMNSFDHRAGR